ncbi:MAG: uridine kinase [Clostridiales bacterium]|nr:MAG: uridine kinase [Clostridiales bacterium]
MKEPMVIGIAGGTGSGKSTLVNSLKEVIGDQVVTLMHDYYYKANKELTLEERKRMNYDHPNAFETDMLVEHVKKLKNNESINHPLYDYVLHTRKSESVLVEPKKVIIVEGILIFENKELRELCDMKIFVDTDADVRIIRRILRDVKERGRTLDSVVNQYLDTVKLMHEEFVEPTKKYADIIVPQGGYNRVATSMIRDRIKVLLNDEVAVEE